MDTPHVDGPLVTSTAEIVQAMIKSHSDSNPMSLDDVAKAIDRVRQALGGSASEPEVVAEELKPAVPIRKSLAADYIICLEDGKKFKSLKRHIRTHYGLSPEEYRDKWGLPADYPMVAPNYSATRSKLAKDNGLGKKVV